MDARRIIGWNIRRLRVAKSFTIEELAGLAGVDESFVARLERGEVNVGVDILEKLARALVASLVDLVADIPPGTPAPKPLKAGRRPGRRKSP